MNQPPKDEEVGVPPVEKKFQNGWTPEVEQLMAEWADKAACYRWMHEKTERDFNTYNQYFTIPVIILSTLTGTANFGLSSMVPDAGDQKMAQAIIGGVSLLTGIITTVANFLRYAQGSEANRTAGISWGKFQRLIAIELSLNPDERSDCMHFLKMCRTELDRLIEQSPPIPLDVIIAFKKEFLNFPGVRKPEIAGEIYHTNIFDGKDERTARMAAETALILQARQGVVSNIVLDELDSRVKSMVEATMKSKTRLQAPLPPTTLENSITARQKEIQQIALGGVVRAMKDKLMFSNQTIGPAPVGIGGVLTGSKDVILHVAPETTDISGNLVDESLPGSTDHNDKL
jgi:hypothetical protein